MINRTMAPPCSNISPIQHFPESVNGVRVIWEAPIPVLLTGISSAYTWGLSAGGC